MLICFGTDIPRESNSTGPDGPLGPGKRDYRGDEFVVERRAQLYRRLPVSAAFHSRYMVRARKKNVKHFAIDHICRAEASRV